MRTESHAHPICSWAFFIFALLCYGLGIAVVCILFVALIEIIADAISLISFLLQL